MKLNLTKANKVNLEKEIKDLKSNISNKENELMKLADDMKMAQLFEDTEEINLIKGMKDDILVEINDLENHLSTKEEEYEALL